MEVGDRFFARHGAKTVFLGRWVTGLRIVAAVMAGATRMPWRTFVVFNALGAIAWAASLASAAALLGPVVVGVLYVGGMIAAALLATGGGARAWLRRRAGRGATAQISSPDGAVDAGA